LIVTDLAKPLAIGYPKDMDMNPSGFLAVKQK
jgi:hypothetical protein